MNTEKTLRLGIVGCGDFLRLQEGAINKTAGLAVTALYDPMEERSRKFAAGWAGSRVCGSAEELLDAEDVDIAAIFVPPWLRKPLVARAARQGKHLITTKPLAPNIADCEEMIREVRQAGIQAGVIYSRTENRLVETLKTLFESGRFGRLALFKQDWMHHYPQWNTWALDPSKNGGPFMDAMIHNLNIARYLMGRPALRGTMFSDRHAHPDLPCADTEFLKLDFEGNGAAHLFITWAADLHVRDASGNYREHVDIWCAITDQGWRITGEQKDGARIIRASRQGEIEEMPLLEVLQTPYDSLLKNIKGSTGHDRTLVSLEEAAEDIRIIQKTSAQPGTLVTLG